MKNDFPLFKLVTQRPNENLTLQECKCPYCNSKKIRSSGRMTTLTGGENHEWYDYSCSDCQKRFAIERKGRNIWMTDSVGRVLNGMPSCFERYIYTCSVCGKDVHRHYLNKETGLPATSLSIKIEDGKQIKSYETRYICDGEHPNNFVDMEQDYWHPAFDHVKDWEEE